MRVGLQHVYRALKYSVDGVGWYARLRPATAQREMASVVSLLQAKGNCFAIDEWLVKTLAKESAGSLTEWHFEGDRTSLCYSSATTTGGRRL